MVKRVCNICGKDAKDDTNFVMPFNLCEDCRLEIAKFIKQLKEKEESR